VGRLGLGLVLVLRLGLGLALGLQLGIGVSRNTAPAAPSAPAQNIGVTAINKAELTCCDVRTGT